MLESLSHSKWDCKYHVVFVPKYRRATMYGEMRKFLVPVFQELFRNKQIEIVKGNMVQDHVHVIMRIPPKYSVSSIIGYMKGKSALAVAKQFGGRRRNPNGESFWARGYAVSTIGFNENVVKNYVENQLRLDGFGYNEDGRF